jgi:hypothetical protein
MEIPVSLEDVEFLGCGFFVVSAEGPGAGIGYCVFCGE